MTGRPCPRCGTKSAEHLHLIETISTDEDGPTHEVIFCAVCRNRFEQYKVEPGVWTP